MKQSIIAILTLLLSLSVLPAYATDTTLVFATEEWKDATNKDGTGLYWDIFRAVYEPKGYKIKPLIRSYEGSINLLKANRADVMVGAYKDEIDGVVYPKNNFAVDIVQVTYKKDKFKWRGLETIKGYSVGWIKGYSYDDYLPPGITKKIRIRKLRDKKTAFHLLDLNRIDFYMEAMGDLNDFFKANSNYRLKDYTRHTLLELKLYIVFTQSARGKKLAGIFDKRFSMLLKKGEIKKLYNRYKTANFSYPSNFRN